MASPTAVKVLHLSAADIMLYPILRDQLVYLRGLGYDVHTASIEGPLAKRLRDEDGLPWTPIPLTRDVAPLKDWRAVRWVERFCSEQGFTIVHTHTPKGNLIGQWGARRAKVPIVLQTLHGFYFHDRMPSAKRTAWIAIERFSAKHSDHILCQNPEDVTTALKEGIAKNGQITLLGNGIDLERFRPGRFDAAARKACRERLGLPADALIVGMCGRFVAEKGFPEFLEAGRRLLDRFPALHLLAVGHKLDSERDSDRWDPAQASLPRDRFSALFDRDDMPDLYACMDVHVLPSHREGFPRVLMEGAASGLAQVATKIRGCRQCIDDGQTGFLVDVQDPSGLSEALAKLLGDEALRARLGATARAKAEQAFDQQRVFRIVADTYARLLSAKHSGNGMS